MNGYIKCGISINGIICQQQKKWSGDTCYNIDESWKHYAKWGGALKKNNILYDYIHMRCLEYENL